MGRNKALLRLGGRTLAEIAVAKLAGVCAEVSIAGNCAELESVAPVVMESRLDAGPGAGIEAGLQTAGSEWCLFVPVDVPFVPQELLRMWAEGVLAGDGLVASYVTAEGRAHPSICLLQRRCLRPLTDSLGRGERRLTGLFGAIQAEFGAGSVRVWDAAKFGAASESFLNLNTMAELGEAERLFAGTRIP